MGIVPTVSPMLGTSSTTEQHSLPRQGYFREVISERVALTLRSKRKIIAKPDGLGTCRWLVWLFAHLSGTGSGNAPSLA